jgi:hypothetical protein
MPIYLPRKERANALFCLAATASPPRFKFVVRQGVPGVQGQIHTIRPHRAAATDSLQATPILTRVSLCSGRQRSLSVRSRRLDRRDSRRRSPWASDSESAWQRQAGLARRANRGESELSASGGRTASHTASVAAAATVAAVVAAAARERRLADNLH